MSKSEFSKLEKIESGLVEDLKVLLEDEAESTNELEKLQIKLNMVHETQIQAAHLAYEDMKSLSLVTAEEVVRAGMKHNPRRMRISFDEMPVVWPLGVKERFIRKMIEYDHKKGDYILSFFGAGVVEGSGVRLTLAKRDAEKVILTYLKHANMLARSLDLSVVQ
jgi:hypothetical protein